MLGFGRRRIRRSVGRIFSYLALMPHTGAQILAVMQELEPVLPGWVRTEMAERSARAEAEQRGIGVEEVWSERCELYPAGRVVTPQEVAEMIAFLASEESSGVSGQAITVALGGVY